MDYPLETLNIHKRGLGMLHRYLNKNSSTWKSPRKYDREHYISGFIDGTAIVFKTVSGEFPDILFEVKNHEGRAGWFGSGHCLAQVFFCLMQHSRKLYQIDIPWARTWINKDTYPLKSKGSTGKQGLYHSVPINDIGKMSGGDELKFYVFDI